MKKRNMPKISAVILAVLICVFAGILIGKLKENYDPEIFSENYISVDEVKQELIFTVYSQEEWDEWFEGGKKDYLTGAVLDELLKRLGVSEQIDFSEKRKNAAVSRTEWNQVYAQILAFLDMEQSVKKWKIRRFWSRIREIFIRNCRIHILRTGCPMMFI